MKNNLLIFCVFIILPHFIFAQKIDNMASFRDIKSNNYFRFNYDNDYFASTDKNYTQGYNFELVAPFLQNNPVNYLFFKPTHGDYKYGLSIEHIGYTPDNIKSSEIQYGDRPFAASIMIKSFSIATDTLHKSRFVSSLNVGLIGPGAFGKEMQVAIHKATGNTIPEGWQNQIKNDLVLNYEVSYEKQLMKYRNLFSLATNANLRLGTLFTNASIGMTATIGIINSPFTAVKNKNKFQFYIYSQPIFSVIGYDASLQGGLFNKKSPYKISSNSLNRLTAQYNYGIVLQTKTMYFEYSRTLLTREYDLGNSAEWGGIKIGFKL